MTIAPRHLLPAALLLLAAPALRAQSAAADSLWAAGEYAAAKGAYEEALRANPGWVRGL